MQLKTLSEAASKTGFALKTVEHWAYRRRRPPSGFPMPIKVGRQLRFIEEEIDTWIAAMAAKRDGVAHPPSPDCHTEAEPKRRGRPRKSAAARCD